MVGLDPTYCLYGLIKRTSWTGWIKWRVWTPAWKNIPESMPRSWFWFQLVFARHSSKLQHIARYDVFLKISLLSARFNPSMATSQLHLQVPTVSVTPDFIDSCNDYISKYCLKAWEGAGSKQHTHTRKGLWKKILFACTANVGFNNFGIKKKKNGVMQCFSAWNSFGGII